MVTLRKRERFRHGTDVATFELECSSDCNAKGKSAVYTHAQVSLITLNRVVFVLSPITPITEGREPSITLRLVVTISGNPVNAPQNAQTGSNPAPAPDHENASPVASAAPYEQPDLEAKAEADKENASANLKQVNPKLAPRFDQLPSDATPGAADAVAGLKSVLSNLEGFVKIADVLADVINACLYFGSDPLTLIDRTKLLIDSSPGQRGVESGQCRLPSRSSARRTR